MPAATTRPLPTGTVLTKPQASEVLRYWLASLQLEEALATRPRARRPLVGHAAPRLESPSLGHDYFKLPLDAALEGLMRDGRLLRKPFDAELAAFFENWLAGQYRRGDDDRDLSHLIAFPVVHLPRGELAGLLRYGAQVRFGTEGAAQFKVPSRSERRRKLFPPAPTEVRLAATPRTARQWPFFVDTRLLQQPLGVTRESIDAYFTALRAEPELDAERMLILTCELLESELRDAAGTTPAPERPAAGASEPEAVLLTRLATAMQRLLARGGSRARVYPVGIVVDGTRAKTTWYLQRELQALIDEQPEVDWELDSCLGAYLTGGALPDAQAVQRALFGELALSESQRHAAERGAASVLTAVQGPPGTGKTTLILHMAAQHVVRQVDALVDDGQMGAGLFAVSSTNNRAVDNVVDPLNALHTLTGAGEQGLPLALRAGSQRVCEQVLSAQLQRAHGWLSSTRARPSAERRAELEAALERFKQLRAELQQRMAARAEACDSATQRNRLQLELAKLTPAKALSPARAPVAGPAARLEPRVVEALYEPLQKAQQRLQELCELCAGKPGLPQLQAVDRQYRRSAKRDLPALGTALMAAGVPFELGLPPALPPSADPAVLLDAWEEAAQAALSKVEELQLELAQALGYARTRQRAEHLERQLAKLPAAQVVPHRPEDDALQRALFVAAVAAREAWAAAESETLSGAVERALHAVRSEYSLRALWSGDAPDEWRQLRQLFGVWGCTLLSLGNCFPARAAAIDQVVIDEAGQCHPTYAVSALLRSRSALIIGDVHQLEPVIGLEPSDDERVREACKLTLDTALLAPYRIHSDARCSVQALADRAVYERPRLIDHFRCQAEIIAICDALCSYGLRVHTPPQAPSVPLPFLPQPVSFIDVAGEQARLGGSWHNPAELAVTLELLQSLFAHGVQPEDVALITPYRGQLEQLQKQLTALGIPIDHSYELIDLDQPPPSTQRGITLGTVHRFQGGERSVVLFSSVVTRRASLGFLDQRENLLNVAVSRARHRFVAIGDRGLLDTGERTRLLTRAASSVSPEAFRMQLRLV